MLALHLIHDSRFTIERCALRVACCPFPVAKIEMLSWHI